MKIEILNTSEGEPASWMFYCVGCKSYHVVPMNRGWTFNGDMENPTFTPSLLTKWDFKNGKPTRICHIIITNGKLRYCGDCSHPLAGQTLQMLDMEDVPE